MKDGSSINRDGIWNEIERMVVKNIKKDRICR